MQSHFARSDATSNTVVNNADPPVNEQQLQEHLQPTGTINTSFVADDPNNTANELQSQEQAPPEPVWWPLHKWRRGYPYRHDDDQTRKPKQRTGPPSPAYFEVGFDQPLTYTHGNHFLQPGPTPASKYRFEPQNGHYGQFQPEQQKFHNQSVTQQEHENCDQPGRRQFEFTTTQYQYKQQRRGPTPTSSLTSLHFNPNESDSEVRQWHEETFYEHPGSERQQHKYKYKYKYWGPETQKKMRSSTQAQEQLLRFANKLLPYKSPAKGIGQRPPYMIS